MQDSEEKIYFASNKQKSNSEIQTNEEMLKFYQSFMGVSKEVLRKVADDLKPCFQGSIYYDPYSSFHQQMAVRIVSHTKDFEFIDLEVRMGNFIFPRISILNIDVKSPNHRHNLSSKGNQNKSERKHQTQYKYLLDNLEDGESKIGQGSYSNVYKCKCNGKNMAIKCLQLGVQFAQSQYIIKMALREHCLLTIASLLEIGPKMEAYFGYNIIIYSNCVQISMELCEQIQNKTNVNFQRLSKDLKQNLLKLHSLKIIHFDIKRDNIAFSPQFNKYIFIDYGLSKMVKQSFGFKTLTHFRGSILYSTPEMVRLYQQQLQDFIDVYYNDMHCLKVTMQNVLKACCLKNSFDDSQINATSTTNFHKIYYIKYALFRNNTELAALILKKQLNQAFFYEINDFFKQLRPSTKIKQFYLHLLDNLKQFNLNSQLEPQNLAINHQSQDRVIMALNKISQTQKLKNANYLQKQVLQENTKNASDVLTNKQQSQRLPINEYLIMLSKAITINCTEFTTQYIIKFCTIAIQILSISIEECIDRLRSIKQLVRVTMFLFRQSIKNKLQQAYFHTFLCALNNAIILSLFTLQQFYSFYQQVVKFNLNFYRKVKLLLNFNTMFRWLAIQCANYTKTHELYNKIYIKNQQILQMLKKDSWQDLKIKTIEAVLDMQGYVHISEQIVNKMVPLIGYQMELMIDIKLYLMFKQNKQSSLLHEDIIAEIEHLLAEKQLYSSFTFHYIYYMFIFYELEKKKVRNLILLLRKYEQVHKINNQEGKLTRLLKIIIQLQLNNYHQGSIKNFISFVRICQQQKNQIVCIYLTNEISYILKKAFYHQEAYLKQQLFQMFLLAKKIRSQYLQFHKNKFSFLTLIQQIRCGLVWQLQLERKLSKLFNQENIIQQNRIIYIKAYRQLQRIFHLNYKKYDLKAKIGINFILSFILFYLKKQREAIDICWNLFFILKSSQNYTLIINFLNVYFTNFMHFMPYRQQQFSQFYLLHLQTIEKIGYEEIYLSHLYVTIPIMEILFRTDHHCLLKFVKKITAKLFIYNFKQNVNKFYQMINFIFNKHQSEQSFYEGCLFLQKNILIDQNPYYIIWFYAIQMKYSRSSINIKYFMIKLFKSAKYLRANIRQPMFQYAIFKYLDQNKLKKRKLLHLSTFLIKNSIVKITETKIKYLYKRAFQWRKPPKHQQQKNNQLKNKIIKMASILIEGINRLNKHLCNRWINILIGKSILKSNYLDQQQK